MNLDLKIIKVPKPESSAGLMVAFGPGKIRSIHIRKKHINQCSLSYCCWDGVLVWSFIHCITCSGVVRNIKKVPKASFISESLCILSFFLRMFISSATITENYTTYWEKVKSTVITGPPAEYVVRGVSTESFQVSPRSNSVKWTIPCITL